MRRVLIGLFSCFSRALNVIRGGHPDMTLSAAAYSEGLWVRPYIDGFFLRVFGEEDHCEKWFWSDVDLAIYTLEQAHQRKRTLTER